MRLKQKLLARQVLAILALPFLLLACTEDRDFDKDNKTVDITLENAERVTLGVLQSTFLAHLNIPIYNFLSGSDLPKEALPVVNISRPDLADNDELTCDKYTARADKDSGTAFYCLDGSNGGVALYSFPAGQGVEDENVLVDDDNKKPAGKEVVGDSVSVEYENFVTESNWLYNGKLNATYTEIEGLSREFIEIDTVSCFVNQLSDLTGDKKIDEQALLTVLLDAQDRDDDAIDSIFLNGISVVNILNSVHAENSPKRRNGGEAIKDTRLDNTELNAIFAQFTSKSKAIGSVTVIDVAAENLAQTQKVGDKLQVQFFDKILVVDGEGQPVLDGDGEYTFVPKRDLEGEPILDSEGNVVHELVVAESYMLAKDELAIIIHHPRNQTQFAVTSIDGDEIYTVVNREDTRSWCQSYERRLSATVTNFSAQKLNDVTSDKEGASYSINGSLTLVDSTEDHERKVNAISNSDFTTSIHQGNLTESYKMENYTIKKTKDALIGSYSFGLELAGNISFDEGLLTISLLKSFLGRSESAYPHGGTMLILGKGLEQVHITVNELDLTLKVDIDGDSNGDDISDAEITFPISWEDLLNRDFVNPELD